MGGAFISWSLAWLGTAGPEYAGGQGAHYVRLALNMLSVIPLALGIVATIPFGRLEQHLLRDPRGVTLVEKKLLMAVRVFNHIAFFVIPNLLEVVREERSFRPSPPRQTRADRSQALRALTAGLVQIGVAGICAALRFIPLWAWEIAALPGSEAQVEQEFKLKQSSQMQQLFRVGVAVAFITLSFLGTAVVRIPIPASGGYFNLGDTFVMAAALLYGPLIGGAVGMLGPALADAIGFPQFILATAVVKGLEGLLIGVVSGRQSSSSRVLTSLAAGIAVLVGGYYIFEAHIYPLLARSIPFFGVTDRAAALAEIVPNLLQGVLSAVIAFGIWRVFARRQE
jgi:uncharacterized membrane protein